MNEVAGRNREDLHSRLGQLWSGRYRLESMLGAGEKAVVYVAADRDGTRVAVKVLRAEVAADAIVRQSFELAGDIANKVGHAGVPKIVDHGMTGDGLPFLVQTLLHGESALARARRSGGTLRAAEVLAIADQALEVLTSAHFAGVVHRNVKPSKLMVGETGEVGVLDFGFTREAGSRVTTFSSAVGTPAFPAPEQDGIGAEVDARADLFSLGATAFYLMTGCGAPLRMAASELPLADPLRQWFTRSLAPDPSVRWANAAEMRESLRKVFESVIGEPLLDSSRVLRERANRSHVVRAETRRGSDDCSPVGDQTELLSDFAPPIGRLVEAAPRAAVAGTGANERLVPASRVQGGSELLVSGAGPGVMLGRYRIDASIGEGGMGRVYRAYDTKLRRAVALKVARSVSGEGTEESLGRFRREALAAAVVQHPNVVAIFDSGDVEGVSYLALELVTGKTVRELLRQSAVSAGVLTGVLVDVARALQAAHECGIIHRDIKPENVIVAEGGIAKVLDFGIARSSHDGGPSDLGTLTRAGTVVGSPRYMAPEQLRGESLDPRTDQYAWGLMAFELLTGQSYATSANPGDLLNAAVMRRLRDEADAGELGLWRLVSVTRTALQHVAAARFPSMEALVQAWKPSSKDGIGSRGHGASSSSMPTGDSEWALRGAETRTSTSLQSRATDAQQRLPMYGRRSPFLWGAVALSTVALVAIVGVRTARDAVPLEDSRRNTEDSTAQSGRNRDAVKKFAEGMHNWRAGARDIAKRAFEEAAELDSSYGAAHLRTAITFLWPNASDRAHFTRGMQLRHTLSPEDAALLDAYEPTFRIPPDVQATRERLEVARRSLPSSLALTDALSQTAIRLGDASLLTSSASEALALEPTFTAGHDRHAVGLALAGDLDGARDEWRACIKISPNATSCFWALAELEANEGNCDVVVDLARRAVANDDHSQFGFWYLARGLFGRDNDVEAVREPFRRIASNGQARAGLMSETNDNVTVALLGGNFRSAEEETDRWLASSASSADEAAQAHPMRMKSRILVELGRAQEAARLAEAFLHRRQGLIGDPLFDSEIEALGTLHVADAIADADFRARRGDWHRRYLERPRRLHGEFVGWLEAYAKTTVSRQDAEDALRALPAQLPLPDAISRNVGIDAPIGHVYLVAGRIAEAIPHLRRAARSCSAAVVPFEHTWATLELGRALEAVGQTEAACDSYHQVVRRWGATAASVTARHAREKLASKCRTAIGN